MPEDGLSFRLTDDFIEQYKTKKVNWGYPDAAGNSLGEITFLRTYSRVKPDGSKEKWWEVCQRVVEGMMSIQKDHCEQNRLPWNHRKAQATAQDAYDRLFTFRWSPPGRGLWMMGTPLVNVQRNSAALQNCAFTSTADMTRVKPSEPFTFLMEASMLGVGVGFDTKGAAKDFTIHEPAPDVPFRYAIPDTREGWVASVGYLIDSYLCTPRAVVEFNYDAIRPAGEPIKTFGGTAAGPQPLMRLHDAIRRLFDGRQGQKLTTMDILDVANLIGVCVVSGNVRRSAELAMGELDDKQFLNAKNYGQAHGDEWIPGPAAYRAEWGWMSNNSVAVNVGDDLTPIIEGISRNGEPGVIWLDISRDYGRLVDPPNGKDHRVAGYNPCAEQSLESFEMCVSGDTKLQLRDGIARISDLVGQSVDVWNGKNWSTVTPFSTGRASLYRVTLSDGSFLDVTPGHEWLVESSKNVTKVVTTAQLRQGMKLPDFSLAAPDGKPFEYAYHWGWIAGDGFVDGCNVMATVDRKDYAILDELGGVTYPEQTYRGGTERFRRVKLTHVMDECTGRIMRAGSGLPAEVFTWDTSAIADFIAGWIDTDGSIQKNPNTEHYVLYGTEGNLRDAQLLLRRIGVDHASVKIVQDAGAVTNKGVRNKALWRLTIPSYECGDIPTRLKKITKIGTRTRVNNAHPGARIDSARRQKIASVELISTDAETYCFTEPRLGQGVFGNVLTKQCTLVETYLNRHADLDDYLRTLKVAYLYAKTVTLMSTHWPKTNAIMQRNRRIGTSASGLANFVDNNSWSELRTWLDEGYKTVQRYDDIYSEWLCVRESIKTTTIKPSGTVSILAGESPGVHWAPGGEYFDRGIVFNANDPLVTLLRAAGYGIEESAYTAGSVFIQFPIHSRARRSEAQVSLHEKANLAVLAQRYWSDNAVSVTLSFDAEKEVGDVGNVLQVHEGQLKTVSFLPRGNTVYKQMPYQESSPERHEEARGRLFQLDLEPLYQGDLDAIDAIGESYCTTDACEIKTPIGATA